jgi:hypothetical protein
MSSEPTQQHNDNLPLALAGVGGGFIFIAIASLVGANWGDITPELRALLVSIPVIGLYLASVFSMRNPANRRLATIVGLAAHASFPFALGVVIRSFTSLTLLDATLVTLVAALTTFWYAIWQSLYRLVLGWWLIIIAGVVWVISLLTMIEASPLTSVLACLGLGVLGIFVANLIAEPNKQKPHATMEQAAYLASSVGTLVLGGAIAATQDLFAKVTTQTDAYGYVAQTTAVAAFDNLWNLMFMLGICTMLIAVAVFTASTAREQDGTEQKGMWLQARYALENAAAALFFMAVLRSIIGISDTETYTDANTAYAIILAANLISIGLGFVFAAAHNVKSWRYAVMITGVVLSLNVLATIFREVQLSSTVIVLAVGIFLVAAAFFVNSIRLRKGAIANSETYRAWFNPTLSQPLWSLGEELPQLAARRAPVASANGAVTFVSHAQHNENQAFFTFILATVVITIVVWFLQLLSNW